jgi:hypothetical protein
MELLLSGRPARLGTAIPAFAEFLIRPIRPDAASLLAGHASAVLRLIVRRATATATARPWVGHAWGGRRSVLRCPSAPAGIRSLRGRGEGGLFRGGRNEGRLSAGMPLKAQKVTERRWLAVELFGSPARPPADRRPGRPRAFVRDLVVRGQLRGFLGGAWIAGVARDRRCLAPMALMHRQASAPQSAHGSGLSPVRRPAGRRYRSPSALSSRRSSAAGWTGGFDFGGPRSEFLHSAVGSEVNCLLPSRRMGNRAKTNKGTARAGVADFLRIRGSDSIEERIWDRESLRPASVRSLF